MKDKGDLNTSDWAEKQTGKILVCPSSDGKMDEPWWSESLNFGMVCQETIE